jgi:hypothetical protein
MGLSRVRRRVTIAAVVLGALGTGLGSSAHAAGGPVAGTLTAAPGPRLMAEVKLEWRVRSTRTTLRSIQLLHGEPGLSVRFLCRGSGCPTIAPPADAHPTIAQQADVVRGLRFGVGAELLVTLTAPGHSAEVLSLTTQRGMIPRARIEDPGIDVDLDLGWRWRGRESTLKSIAPASGNALPTGGTVSDSCSGPGCPVLPEPPAGSDPLRVLEGLHFRAGDRLIVDISHPGYSSERFAATVRDGRRPTLAYLWP